MMLRSLSEKGGIGVYANNLVEELLRIDQKNDYLLYYRDEEHLGRFADRENVTERLIHARNKATWDQIAIPRACRRDRTDVIFHPKFTVPLFAPCKAIMVVHGADWFMPDQAQFYGKLDVAYIRAVMPLYFRKASVVLSVSQLTTDNFEQVLDLPPGKIETVYFGPARHFRPIDDREQLEETRSRYRLPAGDFVFTLTKRGGDGRKNFGQLLAAYRLYFETVEKPLPLVVGGKDCHLFRAEYGIPQDGWGSQVHFPGWLDQQDLPAIYSLATLYLYPSNLEAFPIPITEAMACGTPIVTSSANGLEEIAGDAALLVDPTDPRAIAEAVAKVAADRELRDSLSRQGLARAARFTWEKCGAHTLEIIERVGRSA